MATLASVRTSVQRQGDFENDAHKGTAEINELIVRAYREAWAVLLSTAKTYAVKKYTFTLTGGIGANTLNLASSVTDFLEALKVEKGDGSGAYPQDLPAYDILDRNNLGYLSFTVYDNTLEVEPAESAGGSYRLWYVYKQPDLALDADVLADPVGLLEQYVIDTVTIRLRDKEESDSTVLQQLRADLETKLRRIASMRKGPNVGVDVRRGNIFGFMGSRRSRWMV